MVAVWKAQAAPASGLSAFGLGGAGRLVGQFNCLSPRIYAPQAETELR